MIRKLYQIIMSLRCRISGHRFEPVLQINEYRVVKLMLCTRCKLSIDDLRDDE